MWLDRVKRARPGEDLVDVTWRPFSLDQVNQKVGEDYKVWNEPEDQLPPAVWGLRAGVAAQRQGKAAFERFFPLLLHARHEERKDLGDIELLKDIAKQAALNVEQFEEDLRDRSSLDEVAASHTRAVEEFGVFGTPTFVFPNNGSAFLKMLRPESDEEAVRAVDALRVLMEDTLFVGEVKRPQPPWPKGIR